MDLRVKKTERAIRKAFYELMLEKPIPKITVKELAERAEINKTTFYAHYETIYDLLGTLEQEAIDTVLENLDEFRLLFDDPRTFVYNLYDIFKVCDKNQMKHFPASHSFSRHLGSAIVKRVQQQGIQVEDYEDIGVLIAFLTNGLLGLKSDEGSDLSKESLDYLATFVEGGIRSLPPLHTHS